MSELSWIKCADELPPEGEVVETIISDAKGDRNESQLKRQGSLWFLPDGHMYVYYRPTHWRLAATPPPAPRNQPPGNCRGREAMKIHLAVHMPNQYGGHNLRSLCGRSNKTSSDGMNVTDDGAEVTCRFCKKRMRPAPATTES